MARIIVVPLQIAAISIRVLYRYIVHNTRGQQGISVVGASHRRTGRVVLVHHKVMYTKS